MTTYGVTGASGQFGRLAISALLERGVPAGDVVAVARTTAKIADLAEAGVTVREGDYGKPETLASALAGVDVLLLVSGTEIGRRTAQHQAVVDAAKAAGVTRIAYTSILRADTSTVSLAAEHLATEQLLAASGLPFTLLRNGWYVENYTSQLPGYLAQGAIVDATGGQRVSAAGRADYAAAAATVLTTDGHADAVYELGGPAFTLAELAATITHVTGTTVIEKAVSTDELAAILAGVGLPADTAAFVAGLDAAVARGELETASDDLARLVGRPLLTLAEIVRADAA